MLARAKVNLYLHVVGKRADGYHLLDSLIVFAETGDDIRVSPADDLTLTIDGPFGNGLDTGAGNLVMRAALALRDLAGTAQGAAIHLTKNLPLASGIGGGSADAATALSALIDLWQVKPERVALYKLAEKLGADVPVCLDGRPAFVGGVGEDIEAAGTLPETHILLVNPLVETPTPAVFKARRGGFSESARWHQVPATAADLAAYLKGRKNDLTDPAIVVAPVVADVLGAIAATPACLLSRLSGSGATCFGLYESAAAADAARAAITARHPGWWSATARIAS
ncbi:MAG: 4-(cytidine 5'-diphospho)-2-C-methyl-D-erythritol kinase [Proteobacteria bacterium]|nr:4-(cytidine 5'-diphospho)-2-C-methyl-D-erythritol kinase [Pseudomonadota bacterium]